MLLLKYTHNTNESSLFRVHTEHPKTLKTTSNFWKNICFDFFRDKQNRAFYTSQDRLDSKKWQIGTDLPIKIIFWSLSPIYKTSHGWGKENSRDMTFYRSSRLITFDGWSQVHSARVRHKLRKLQLRASHYEGPLGLSCQTKSGHRPANYGPVEPGTEASTLPAGPAVEVWVPPSLPPLRRWGHLYLYSRWKF